MECHYSNVLFLSRGSERVRRDKGRRKTFLHLYHHSRRRKIQNTRSRESNGRHGCKNPLPYEPFRNTLRNTQDETRNKKTSLSFLPGIYAGVVRGVQVIKSASADARARRKVGPERRRAVAKVVADIIMLAETAEIAAFVGSRRPPRGAAWPSHLRKSGVM